MFSVSCFFSVSFEAICLPDDILRTKASATFMESNVPSTRTPLEKAPSVLDTDSNGCWHGCCCCQMENKNKRTEDGQGVVMTLLLLLFLSLRRGFLDVWLFISETITTWTFSFGLLMVNWFSLCTFIQNNFLCVKYFCNLSRNSNIFLNICILTLHEHWTNK